ncbi:MAG TPA: peptidylprolyl isomerase [Ktedonobacteraceae bacterium]|nr:peptidylprolyl isomerase [Ktedonobacteraceae bacterium]
MNSQTARRPDNKRSNKRPNRSNNKAGKYTKQTARFEGKRDGKPLIFGWGGHLSHNEKVQLQKRATWATAIGIGLLIVIVIVGFWININVVTPGLPITSVNGHPIPQSLYRKMVAFQTELAQNNINGPHGLTAQRDSLRTQVATLTKSVNDTNARITSLNAQLKALPAGSSIERTNLTAQLKGQQAQLAIEQSQLSTANTAYSNLTQTTLPQAQANFNQSQVGNDSVNWLQQDELIREWLATQSSAVQAKVNPTPSAVSHAMNDFIANIPKSSSYSAFLSRDSVSDSDMQAMMTVKLRRDNMQAYLASQIVSPAYQVLARSMTIDTQAHAQKVLKQLQAGGNFGTLAKANSSDANTNTKGGDLGWLVRGQYAQNFSAAVVENWLFDPHRKLNEISPILYENGAYHIVQLLAVDPSRPVDASTLQTLKNNALANWVIEQEALPTAKVTSVDQNMLLDTANMPPDLPLSAPSGITPTP